MAVRYSGEIMIRIRYLDMDPRDLYSDGTFRHPNGSYRCVLSRIVNRGTQWEHAERTTIIVGAPRSLSHAVDSSEAYDDTARAAIAFAEDEDGGNGWGDASAWEHDGSDRYVGRSYETRWPKEPNHGRKEA